MCSVLVFFLSLPTWTALFCAVLVGFNQFFSSLVFCACTSCFDLEPIVKAFFFSIRLSLCFGQHQSPNIVEIRIVSLVTLVLSLHTSSVFVCSLLCFRHIIPQRLFFIFNCVEICMSSFFSAAALLVLCYCYFLYLFFCSTFLFTCMYYTQASKAIPPTI